MLIFRIVCYWLKDISIIVVHTGSYRYIQCANIKEEDMNDNVEVKLQKKLGFWAIWAIGVGSVVGDGIFLLIGEGIDIAGPSALLGFVIAGFIQMFMMVALGEFAVAMPNAGAMAVWVERIFGRGAGFISSMSFAIGWVITGGSTGLACGIMTCYFFPGLNLETWSMIFAILWICIFSILNIIGVGITAKVQLFLVMILMAFMFILGILGLPYVELRSYQPFFSNGVGGMLKAIPIGTYAYMGAITLCTAGGECKEPKNMPKALVWSSVTFLIVYTLAQFVCIGVLTPEQITMKVSPFTVAAEVVFGKVGGNMINLAGLIAASTTILGGTIYASSRIFYEQAKQGLLPPIFGKLHPRFQTPVFGIVVVWVVSIVLILFGKYGAEYIYTTLCNQVVFAWCVSWTLALAAAIKYRKNHYDEIKTAGWQQPLFPAFPIIGIIGAAMIMWTSYSTDLVQMIIGVAWLIVLLLFYAVYGKNRVSESEVE